MDQQQPPGYSQPYTPQPQPTFIVPAPAPAPLQTSTSVTQINLGSGGGQTIPGSCPVCHNTSWTQTYPCCAWFLCIFFFPIGILCCLCMSQKKCTKCGFALG